jgi:hypothetical protein
VVRVMTYASCVRVCVAFLFFSFFLIFVFHYLVPSLNPIINTCWYLRFLIYDVVFILQVSAIQQMKTHPLRRTMMVAPMQIMT